MVFTFQPPFFAGLSGYIAEMGAAFLGAQLGLAIEPRRDHAPYISSWLKVLRDDPRAVITAASKAQIAVNYLIELVAPQEVNVAAERAA
jgi:antirestriction protein ArdC